MIDPIKGHVKFQWKWVWVTLGMFTIFYVLPLLIATRMGGTFGSRVIGGWSFGGIIVISAASAMFSKGVTIWETAVAGALLTVLWYGIYQILHLVEGLPIRLQFSSLVVVMIAIFGLSLLGAGIGEGIQNVRKAAKKEADEVSGLPTD